MENSKEENAQSWFAIRVRPKHEKTVAQFFEMKEMEQMLPLYRVRRRWADRMKELDLPLFPGYVFCRFDPRVRTPVLNTPGVLYVVKCGDELARVDDEEIQALQAAAQARLTWKPWEYMSFGEQVEIVGGPFLGTRAILLDIRKSARVVLSVNLLQRSVLVEIDAEWVRPLRPRPGIGPAACATLPPVRIFKN